MPTALLIDDDNIFRQRLARAISDRSWTCYDSGEPDDALAMARNQSLDLILLDLRMPAASGLDLIPVLRACCERASIVVLTGYGSIATAVEAMRQGADHYLTKPLDADQIIDCFEQLTCGHANEVGPAMIPAPSLARVEYEHIQRVLADCDGNISRAARILGVHRRSLQRKLYKIPPND